MRHSALVLVLSTLAASCRGTPGPAPAPIPTERLEAYEVGRVQRVRTLGGIFLGTQPGAADLELLADAGFRTVVDVRGTDEARGFDEPTVVRELGMEYVPLPWSGPEQAADAVFDRARGLFERAQRPMFVHGSTADRVGALWIPWRALDGGLTIDAAVAEARVVGLRSTAYERAAREYVARRRP